MGTKSSLRSRQSLATKPSYGILNSAEVKTGIWWDKFNEAKVYFDAHGVWPLPNHPSLGEWVRRVNKSLYQRRKQINSWQGSGDYALTPDRALALHEAKYEPNNTGLRRFKNGRLASIMESLAKNESLNSKDMNYLKTSYTCGRMGKRTSEALKAYGIDFDK